MDKMNREKRAATDDAHAQSQVRKMEFQDVFEYIGDIGVYQLLLFFTLGIINIINGVQGLAPNFFYAPMDHWCRVTALQNYSYDTQKYVAIPIEDDGTEYDSCRMHDLNYDDLTEEDILNWNRTLNPANGTIECSGWVYDRWEFDSTIISKYDLVCDRSWMAELTSTLYMVGILIGSVGSGAVADRFGRKWPMMISLAGYFAFALVQGYAPNYTTFVIFRVLNAVFNMTAWLCSYVMVMELIGPKYNVMLAILIQIFFSVGIMLVAGYSYAIRDVQKLFIVCAAPIACTFMFLWTVPESPRWQIANGRYKQAEKTLKFIAEVNGRKFPDKVTWKLRTDNKAASQGTWGDLCHSSILCRELAIVYLNWFTASLVYYGVSFNAGAFGDVFLNTFLSGIIEVPAIIICWLCLAYAGRRWANGASLLITGLFCLSCVPIIIVRPDMEDALTALSTLGKGAITFSFSSIYLYSAELFPTPVRQLALGSASMFGRFGSMASPYLGRTLEEVWSPLPSVIFGVLSIFTGCIVFLLPETKGWPLPDTIQDAENIGRGKRPVADEMAVDEMEDEKIVYYSTMPGQINPVFEDDGVVPEKNGKVNEASAFSIRL